MILVSGYPSLCSVWTRFSSDFQCRLGISDPSCRMFTLMAQLRLSLESKPSLELSKSEMAQTVSFYFIFLYQKTINEKKESQNGFIRRAIFLFLGSVYGHLLLGPLLLAVKDINALFSTLLLKRLSWRASFWKGNGPIRDLFLALSFFSVDKNMLQSLLISAHSRIPCNWVSN